MRAAQRIRESLGLRRSMGPGLARRPLVHGRSGRPCLMEPESHTESRRFSEFNDMSRRPLSPARFGGRCIGKEPHSPFERRTNMAGQVHQLKLTESLAGGGYGQGKASWALRGLSGWPNPKAHEAVEPAPATAHADGSMHPAHFPLRLIAAGTVGNILEWYDFAIFGYFAAAIGRQFFPAGDATTSLIAAFGAFAAGFVMRPLGGVVFGHVGDRVGRKAALTISVLAMAIATFLIGILPGYTTITHVAAVLLVVERMCVVLLG